MYETEAGNLFFICERHQLVATATGVVNLRCLTRWELLRALGAKDEEQRQRKVYRTQRNNRRTGEESGDRGYVPFLPFRRP